MKAPRKIPICPASVVSSKPPVPCLRVESLAGGQANVRLLCAPDKSIALYGRRNAPGFDAVEAA